MIFTPYTIESCITEGLNRMDPPADPYSTQSFDLLDSGGMLSEVRAEFLFSCALYGLIPEQSIESILGDVPMQSLPEGGKYRKTDLVTQCSMNPVKIEELVGELENMEGNAAEIAGAVIEVRHPRRLVNGWPIAQVGDLKMEKALTNTDSTDHSKLV